MQEGKKSLLWQIFSKKMGICIILGFSSGLPLYLLLTLIPAFLAIQKVDVVIIGFYYLSTAPYSWKFLWAPLLDRYKIFSFSRRKGWIFITQLFLIILICTVGFFDPNINIYVLPTICALIAFISATQDIAIDAFRREILDDHQLGLGNSIFVNAYRLANLIPGSLSLILYSFMSWKYVFIITALFLAIPCVCTLFYKENTQYKAAKSLKEAVILPFVEFINRKTVLGALLTLLFVILYKLGDSMATALATPFYIDVGYSLTTIGLVAKNVSLWSTVIGGIIGGIIMLKIGINKALWYFGVGQVVTILGFVYLAGLQGSSDLSIWPLSIVIGAEALGAGLGTAAFVAFISRETNPLYTATQLALLTSLSSVPRTIVNSFTGVMVSNLGWENFFYLCTFLAIPGMLLLFVVAPFNKGDQDYQYK